MVAAMVYMAVGLACISMCFNLIMEEMIAKFVWMGRKINVVEPESVEVEQTEPRNPGHDSAYFMSSSDVVVQRKRKVEHDDRVTIKC